MGKKITELDVATEFSGSLIQEHETEGTQQITKEVFDNHIEDMIADETSASDIKTKYESNSDTNAFTDDEKAKLGTVEEDANNYVLPSDVVVETELQTGLDTKEDVLGNPDTDGYVLSSDVDGNRTWVERGDVYQGEWDALTDTPTLPTASEDNRGYWYNVSVAGNGYEISDKVRSDGSSWVREENTQVQSDFAETDTSSPAYVKSQEVVTSDLYDINSIQWGGAPSAIGSDTDVITDGYYIYM